MLPIVIVSIIALAGPCSAWPSLISRPDAAFRANVLLIDTNPNALTLAQLIETANGLINANQVHSKSVGKILHALVGLEQMVRDSAVAKYTCGSDQIANLAAIHNALEQHTTDGTYYLEHNSKRRLNEKLVAFQVEYAKVCLNRFKENYAEIYNEQPQKMKAALDYLSDLITEVEEKRTDKPWEDLVKAAKIKDGKHVPTGKLDNISAWSRTLTRLQALLGDKAGLRKINPKTGLLEVSVPETKEFLINLVEGTCSHYELRPEAVDIFERTRQLVASIRPSYHMYVTLDEKFRQLSMHTIGNMVCKDMKVIDINDLAKRIAEDINKRGN